MSTAGLLPHITATLNALSSLLLIAGFLLVRFGNRDTHRKVMMGALASSALFLAFYLVYHFTAPVFVFPGPDSVKPLYYTLLISHVVLSLVILPFIFLTVKRALAGAVDRHRPMARFTLPVWLYVSVSGFVVYLMLYHVYPPAA
ncbi:MAG: DUF420 domain-containing protein [Alphaproteobacteria bacterium]|jgi:putative membrane protein|nr:DUF420 domain-containing protein [Alphaproteobacteria bacterium]MBF0354562.1 DUF420 domain-containing protein [Alphaproteobacteria bacterium]